MTQLARLDRSVGERVGDLEAPAASDDRGRRDRLAIQRDRDVDVDGDRAFECGDGPHRSTGYTGCAGCTVGHGCTGGGLERVRDRRPAHDGRSGTDERAEAAQVTDRLVAQHDRDVLVGAVPADGQARDDAPTGDRAVRRMGAHDGLAMLDDPAIGPRIRVVRRCRCRRDEQRGQDEGEHEDRGGDVAVSADDADADELCDLRDEEADARGEQEDDRDTHEIGRPRRRRDR